MKAIRYSGTGTMCINLSIVTFFKHVEHLRLLPPPNKNVGTTLLTGALRLSWTKSVDTGIFTADLRTRKTFSRKPTKTIRDRVM